MCTTGCGTDRGCRSPCARRRPPDPAAGSARKQISGSIMSFHGSGRRRACSARHRDSRHPHAGLLSSACARAIMLQQHQLHGRNQRPSSVHLQRLDGPGKPSTKLGEFLLRITVLGVPQKASAHRQRCRWACICRASRTCGKSLNVLERFRSQILARLAKANVVVQPLQVFGRLGCVMATQIPPRQNRLQLPPDLRGMHRELCFDRGRSAATTAVAQLAPAPPKRGIARQCPGMLVARPFASSLISQMGVVGISFLSVTGGLQLEHLRIAPPTPAAASWLPSSAITAVLQHHDAVGHAHGGETVRDEQRHLALGQFGKAFENFEFSCAHRAPRSARRGSATARRAGRRAPAPLLPLAARKIHAAFEAPAQHLLIAAAAAWRSPHPPGSCARRMLDAVEIICLFDAPDRDVLAVPSSRNA